MKIKSFKFNAFEENTYILYDDSGECLIIDPGCSNSEEEKVLNNFVKDHKLHPQKLINTHCHIDHVLGNQFVADTFGLLPEAHRGEVIMLNLCTVFAQMHGIPYNPSPPIERFIEEKEIISCGNFELIAIFTPGHSPASLSFFHQDSKQLIAGDVLFNGSIGRTDLPGGDYDTLISSIKEKLFPLGPEVKVYPGHGPETTIGQEKKYNPFLQ